MKIRCKGPMLIGSVICLNYEDIYVVTSCDPDPDSVWVPNLWGDNLAPETFLLVLREATDQEQLEWAANEQDIRRRDESTRSGFDRWLEPKVRRLVDRITSLP